MLDWRVEWRVLREVISDCSLDVAAWRALDWECKAGMAELVLSTLD